LNALPPVMIVGIVTACVRWPFRVTAQLTGSVELPKLGRFLRGISQVLNFLDHVVIFGGSIFVSSYLQHGNEVRTQLSLTRDAPSALSQEGKARARPAHLGRLRHHMSECEIFRQGQGLPVPHSLVRFATFRIRTYLGIKAWAGIAYRSAWAPIQVSVIAEFD